MKLVVGLGNPGRRYEGTRHNIGYAVLAEVARKFGEPPPKGRFHGAVVEAELGGQKSLLLSPTTYMNLSGTSVQEAKSFYKLANEDLLVICDDLNLPRGQVRFRHADPRAAKKVWKTSSAVWGRRIFRGFASELGRRPKVGRGPTTC